jgi:hypothetical protein
VQQQQLTGYVAEPWEVTEPWEVAEQQQQPYNGQHVANSWLDSQQPQLQLPAQQCSFASSALPEADAADAGVWLLVDDLDADEQQEREEGAGLYYIGEADEAEQEQQLWQGGRQLMQDMQRAMQPPQELQRLQQQQQVPPKQLLVSGSTEDLQGAWEQAMTAAASLLASYDVRYDVQRPPRLSSSRGRLRGPAAVGVGPQGLGPAEVCLTAAAAAAAAAKARRVRKPQVNGLAAARAHGADACGCRIGCGTDGCCTHVFRFMATGFCCREGGGKEASGV